MDYVDLVCQRCQKKFQIPQSRIGQQAGKYCSRKCAREKIRSIREFQSQRQDLAIQKRKEWKDKI